MKRSPWGGRLRAVFQSGIGTEPRVWVQHCSCDTSYAGVCFGSG